ncbi:hypothetical protein MKX01_039557 [Papaver californicum]|nr:hypothetical protein MKX01_042745 [Papaver californicum]KAI3988019.1 hypothetical protein MKX01_039557 [Papaver californicum]
MDQMVMRERDFEVDLESGGTTSDEDRRINPSLRQSDNFLGRAWNRFTSNNEGLIISETPDPILSSSDGASETAELLTERKSEGEEQTMGNLEKKKVKEKRKKTISKKPPRPPRGPALDAVDRKMVKEITELAILKRARIERMKKMKKMKKMKAAKAATPFTSILAMLFTILFCLVIVFHGIFVGDSPRASLEAPLQSEVGSPKKLISVQLYKSKSAKRGEALGSSFSKSVDRSRVTE